MSNGKIFGPDDKLIAGDDERRPLPVEVQALVKTEVNAAMDIARQRLEDQFSRDRRDANTKALIRYGVLVLANMLFAFVLWWVSGPDKVREWTREYVREAMNKPALDRAAEEVVADKMDAFATGKLQPVLQSVKSLQDGIDQAAASLGRLREEQKVMASVNRAEAFNADAYRELQTFAQENDEQA